MSSHSKSRWANGGGKCAITNSVSEDIKLYTPGSVHIGAPIPSHHIVSHRPIPRIPTLRLPIIAAPPLRPRRLSKTQLNPSVSPNNQIPARPPITWKRAIPERLGAVVLQLAEKDLDPEPAFRVTGLGRARDGRYAAAEGEGYGEVGGAGGC